MPPSSFAGAAPCSGESARDPSGAAAPRGPGERERRGEHRASRPASARPAAAQSTATAANFAPASAPRLAPTMITGNSRCPLLRLKRVGGKRPELGDHHHAEDADPDEERERRGDAVVRGSTRSRACSARRTRVTACSRRAPSSRRAHRAVRGDHEHQHQRDHRDTVRAHLGREIREDERLAQRLDDRGRRRAAGTRAGRTGTCCVPHRAACA